METPVKTLGYTIVGLCEALHISRSHFYNLPPEDRPKIIRLGRRVVITPQAAAEWLAEMQRRTEADAEASPLPEPPKRRKARSRAVRAA